MDDNKADLISPEKRSLGDKTFSSCRNADYLLSNNFRFEIGVGQDTFVSWTRDLEYYAKRQKLGNYWPPLQSYFEASFADHVTTVIVRLSKEAA